MSDSPLYTTQLQAGLGLVDETRALLELWHEGMSASELRDAAVEQGVIPSASARRIRNVVAECFAPRYLRKTGGPAHNIKRLQPSLNSNEFRQLLFMYTCRANLVLADFVREIYWDRYAGGYDRLTREDARGFIERAIDDGKTSKRWSEATVTRMSNYLLGACADYGLLGPLENGGRVITAPRIEDRVLVYLAYELHFEGLGDNALLKHPDWELFGLEWDDVRNEMQRLSRDGHWIVQSAGEVTQLSWRYKTMEETLDVLAQA